MKKVPTTELMDLVSILTGAVPSVVAGLKNWPFVNRDAKVVMFDAAERIYDEITHSHDTFGIADGKLFKLTKIYGNGLFEFIELGTKHGAGEYVKTIRQEDVSVVFKEFYIDSRNCHLGSIVNSEPFWLGNTEKLLMGPFTTPDKVVCLKTNEGSDFVIIRFAVTVQETQRPIQRAYVVDMCALMNLITQYPKVQEVLFENNGVMLIGALNEYFRDSLFIQVADVEHIRISVTVRTEEVDYGNSETHTSV